MESKENTYKMQDLSELKTGTQIYDQNDDSVSDSENEADGDERMSVPSAPKLKPLQSPANSSQFSFFGELPPTRSNIRPQKKFNSSKVLNFSSFGNDLQSHATSGQIDEQI